MTSFDLSVRLIGGEHRDDDPPCHGYLRVAACVALSWYEMRGPLLMPFSLRHGAHYNGPG